MATTLTRADLRLKLENGEPAVLVEALPEMYYRKQHLPGAENIPPGQVDDLARDLLPDSAAEIVVYCMDEECPSSAELARQLEERGYTNVKHYEGGKQDWIEAGLPTESGVPVSAA